MKRLNFYVDGFNLYFGMISAGLTDCVWLDIQRLANTLKHSSHNLNIVNYFTSRVNNNYGKQKRQNTYLDALASTEINIIYGQFRSELMKCKTCGNDWYESKEKMTDVNIATQLMIDAYKDNFDVAMLVSGDSDLVPPVKNILELFPQKEIWIAFPPNRDSNELKKVASGSFKIGKNKLQSSQFPNVVTSRIGVQLTNPFY